MSDLLEAARWYLRRGYMPVYVPPGTKGPTQKDWQSQRLSEEDLPEHFARPGNIGIILGEPSGGLVDVDLDCQEAVELADQFLPETGAVTGRPSARRSHRWYVSDVPATKQFRDPKANRMIVELRSTGGQTLVGPSIHESDEPYDALEGDPAEVPAPMLTACVQALYEEVVRGRHGELPSERKPPRSRHQQPVELDEDTLQRRARAYLDATPPAISGQGGHNATFAAATALVHGFGIPAERAFELLAEHYNPRCQPPWSEKELRHKVDDAAVKPHERPFGWLREPEPDARALDLSGIVGPPQQEAPQYEDPGPLPEHLLRVPGLIDELTNYTLDTAPYPNLVLAFSGALILQSFLAGRKVRDDLNIRTNLYLLGLASSGVGKEHPRKVNQQVLLGIDLQDCLGDAFASGEGIEDRLYVQPSLLFQTDEIDKVLKSIKRGTQSRWDKIVEVLLKLYSAADSLYPCRAKADQEHRVIDQPSLCLFGTAIPTHYYGAMSEDLLTNGLFARMLILEAGERADEQAPPGRPLPKRVLDAARAWAALQPGSGNIGGEHPQPQVVPATADARQLLMDCQKETDALYREQKEEMARAVWARAHEKTRRLALIYACSRDHQDLLVTSEGVEWAWALVEHLSRRMCYMADIHAFETDHEERRQKFLEFFREHGGEWVPLWKIGRKFRKLDNKIRDAVLEALVDSRFIEPGPSNVQGTGVTGRRYRLLDGGEQ